MCNAVNGAMSGSIEGAMSSSIKGAMSGSIEGAMSNSVKGAMSSSIKGAMSTSVENAKTATVLSHPIIGWQFLRMKRHSLFLSKDKVGRTRSQDKVFGQDRKVVEK